MPQSVPAAQRALRVFEIFAREGRPLTNSDLARLLDMADSSCSDLLWTLREAGFLMRTPKSRFFYPTSRLQDLAQRIAATDPIQIFANEALELLTKQTGETSMCGQLDGINVKIYACQDSSRALRYVLQPGTIVAAHSTALGKAILGAMNPVERDALVEKLPMDRVTPSTVVDRHALRREVDAAASRGWFLAREEGGEGITAIGIAGSIGGRLTALSVVGPTQRMENNLAAYVEVMQEARKGFFLFPASGVSGAVKLQIAPEA